MEENVKQSYIESGKVIQKARKKARQIAEPGTDFETIAEEIENLIRDEGLQPAFPVNLSANSEAAHYSPERDDDRVLKEDDVLKIDIGAHSNGYIADTALTVNPSGEKSEMIEANQEILSKALEFVEPGITVGELGTHVQNQVPDNYKVVRNLTGHYLGKYTQHAGISIPNVRNKSGHVIEEGDAIAIEPFLSTGTGKIKEGKKGNIYKLEKDRNVRGRTERKVLKKIKSFNGLPFSLRWMDLKGKENMVMKKLVKKGIVKHYPILREKSGETVTQAEHTVLVGAAEDGSNIITTRR